MACTYDITFSPFQLLGRPAQRVCVATAARRAPAINVTDWLASSELPPATRTGENQMTAYSYAHYHVIRDRKVLMITPHQPSLFGPREEILVTGLAHAQRIARRRGSRPWNFMP